MVSYSDWYPDEDQEIFEEDWDDDDWFAREQQGGGGPGLADMPLEYMPEQDDKIFAHVYCQRFIVPAERELRQQSARSLSHRPVPCKTASSLVLAAGAVCAAWAGSEARMAPLEDACSILPRTGASSGHIYMKTTALPSAARL